jgi:hypothetical protein
MKLTIKTQVASLQTRRDANAARLVAISELIARLPYMQENNFNAGPAGIARIATLNAEASTLTAENAGIGSALRAMATGAR